MGSSAAAARRARGITLIECVIALGILAALMSIALPSFADAMARARLRGAGAAELRKPDREGAMVGVVLKLCLLHTLQRTHRVDALRAFEVVLVGGQRQRHRHAAHQAGRTDVDQCGSTLLRGPVHRCTPLSHVRQIAAVSVNPEREAACASAFDQCSVATRVEPVAARA